MGSRLTKSKWVEKYLKFIENQDALRFIDIPGLKIIEANPWSFLKMATIWSFAHYTYLPIIKKNYTNAIYVDLFSGPGMTVDKITKRRFIGTALLMATIQSSRGGFNKCIFVDIDKESIQALEARLDKLRNEGLLTCEHYITLHGDCNNIIEQVISEVEIARSHILLFVDPFGINCHFRTLKAFIDTRTAFDMFMNLQIGSVARSTGRDTSGCTTEEMLKACFPDDTWMECREAPDMRECLKDRYIAGLKRYGREKIRRVEPIRVRGSHDYYYYLLFTTRKESSGWINGIERIKEMVESYDHKSITHYLKGGKTLEDFDPE